MVQLQVPSLQEAVLPCSPQMTRSGKEFGRPSIPCLDLTKNGNFVPRELALEVETHGIDAAGLQCRKSASAKIDPSDTRGAEQFQAK